MIIADDTREGTGGGERGGQRRTGASGTGQEAPDAAATATAREECRGFRWIGQSLATCDDCGKPAWEHEGELRLREGVPFYGGTEDWELRPWKPGEADAIKRKWANS